MSKDSTNEADKPTTNENSREITANELSQVVAGMGPVFLSLMPYPQKGPLDSMGDALAGVTKDLKPPPI
jgi:hypothetical protein